MVKRDNPDKIRWHCRRGMLELDMLLLPYFDACYSGLSLEEKNTFQRLIEIEDNCLWAWLVKQEPCDDPDLQDAIHRILAFKSQN